MSKPTWKNTVDADQIWAKYINSFSQYLYKENILTPQTIIHYTHDVTLFVNYLLQNESDVAHPHQVTPAHLHNYIQHLVTVRHNGRSTLRRRMASLKRFFQFVDSDSPNGRTPMVLPEKISIEPLYPKALTRDEAKQFLAMAKTTNAPLRDHAIFSLFLTCGCTLSELLQLTLSDFDRQARTIRFIGKHKERTLPLSAICYDSLTQYIQQRSPAILHDGLLLNQQGGQITKGAVYHALTIIRRRLPQQFQDISLQILRNTCFILLWKSGVSLVRLHAMTGHASMETSRRYTLSPRDVKGHNGANAPGTTAFPLDDPPDTRS